MTATVPKFMAINRSKIWMQVADQIKDMIDRGEFAPGEKLPSERELCEQFGVSRMSIREALRKLQAQSYIDVKSGLGTFVVEAGERSIARLGDWLETHVDSLKKLIELRMVIEPGIAELVAKRATETEVESLRVHAKALATSDADKASGVDAAFHQELASITKNSMIEQIVEEILDATHDLRHVTLKDREHMMLASDGHAGVVDAISKHDSNAAAAAMRRHLVDARTSLLNSETQEK